VPKGVSAPRLRLACLAAAVTLGIAAQAADTRALYRWTDEQGRIQYSDRPPIKFKGEVTRIDVELDSNTRPATRPPLVAPDVMRDVVPVPPDMAKTRRDTREKLDALVRVAQDKVAAAKAALAGGGDIHDDEQQVVQRRYAKAPAGKSNCRVDKDGTGKTVVVCPALTPNDAYYERQRALEDLLKKAEEELTEAEYAYRRGVD
jgi:hypothetical protein